MDIGEGDKTVQLKFNNSSSNDIFKTKNILFLCFACKKYLHGNANDSYEHKCDGTQNNGLKECMSITINALFYFESTDLTSSSIQFPESPSLRSSMFNYSTIRRPLESEDTEKLHRFVTSTPKEINCVDALNSFVG